MSDLTVRELKRDAARVKHEVDELDRVAHGMTFDELLRLLAGQKPDSTNGEKKPAPDGAGARMRGEMVVSKQ